MYVTIYTDGACLGNPGPGGAAAVLLSGEHEKTVVWAHPDTTNIQMELEAILIGLDALKMPCRVVVRTDSLNAIGWLGEGWKRKNEQVRFLCQQIEELIRERGHVVRYEHVRGHMGDKYNELADQLAKGAARTQVKSVAQRVALSTAVEQGG